MHFDCNLLFWLGIHCHIISQKSYKETTTPLKPSTARFLEKIKMMTLDLSEKPKHSEN
jgi:hypothetical protein